jgi:hypothetical protein
VRIKSPEVEDQLIFRGTDNERGVVGSLLLLLTEKQVGCKDLITASEVLQKRTMGVP